MVYFTILLSSLGYPRSRRKQYLHYGMSGASRILRTSDLSTHVVNCVCTYEGASGNPNSDTPELRRSQDDRPAVLFHKLHLTALLFPQQIIRRVFKNTIYFILFNF